MKPAARKVAWRQGDAGLQTGIARERETSTDNAAPCQNETVVIWRDAEGWEPEDFGHDSEWSRQEELTKGADLVHVNGNNVIDGARSPDAVFKRLMLAEAAA